MNRVILIGNLSKDPEVTTTTNDITNCKFSVAVSRRYGSKETDFFTIVTWRTLAENCGKFLRKGSKVGICGSIQNKNYEASDGTKRYTTEIVADEVQFLSSKNDMDDMNDLPEAPAAPAVSGGKKKANLTPVDDDGELPF